MVDMPVDGEQGQDERLEEGAVHQEGEAAKEKVIDEYVRMREERLAGKKYWWET